MMSENFKEFIKVLHDRGHNPEIIVKSYAILPLTDEDINVLLTFFKNNPKASHADDNWEIHRIYLKHRGINL